MVTHHAFGFPSFYIKRISYPSLADVASHIADGTKICVSLFAFLTGTAYALRKDHSYKYSFRKIVLFLLEYWIVYVLLLMISVLCGYKPTASEITLELFGIKMYIMRFGWYVSFYICTMLILPIYVKLISLKDTLEFTLLATGVLYFIVRVVEKLVRENDRYMVVSSFSIWFPVVVSGFLSTKYNLLNKIYNKITETILNSLFIGIILFSGCFVLQVIKGYVKGISMGVITAPMLILGIALMGVYQRKWIGIKALELLGKYSMNIWFLHCLFFSVATREFFQGIAYIMKIPVLVVCWILILCLVASIPISKFQNKIISIVSNILNAKKL